MSNETQTKLKTRNSRDILIQLNGSYFKYLSNPLCFIIYILLTSWPFFSLLLLHYIIRVNFAVSPEQEILSWVLKVPYKSFSVICVDVSTKIIKEVLHKMSQK